MALYRASRSIVLFLSLAMTSCYPFEGLRNKAIQTGERNYAVEPFASSISNEFSYSSSPFRNADLSRSTIEFSLLAYQLKNTSDVLCNKYKIDLALSQTGWNFLADITNVFLGALGGGIGGVTAQATSAATGAVTGVKNTISSDIYQKVTDIVSNYIDTSRDEEWIAINNKLKKKLYQNKAEVFNDVQTYHSRCSLVRALATAAKESGNKKVDADQAVEDSSEGKTKTDQSTPARGSPGSTGHRAQP